MSSPAVSPKSRPRGVSVLAERAVPVEEATGTIIDDILAEARSLAAAATPEMKDMAEKTLADVLALRDAVAH